MSTELKRVTNVSWRKFLATEPGMEGMLYLREKIPSIQRGTSDSIIFDAGRTQGFKDCLDTISELLGTVEVPNVDLENR